MFNLKIIFASARWLNSTTRSSRRELPFVKRKICLTASSLYLSFYRVFLSSRSFYIFHFRPPPLAPSVLPQQPPFWWCPLHFYLLLSLVFPKPSCLCYFRCSLLLISRLRKIARCLALSRSHDKRATRHAANCAHKFLRSNRSLLAMRGRKWCVNTGIIKLMVMACNSEYSDIWLLEYIHCSAAYYDTQASLSKL